MKRHLLAGAALLGLTAPAMALDLSDWNVQPYQTEIGDAELKVNGQANGSAYTASQPDAPGLDQNGVTGAAWIGLSLERTYDSGLALALKSSFEVYHDRLSGDNYGSDFVQKVYGEVQTGLGRVEIGDTDGPAYALAVVGPTVEGYTSIDNPNATFFRDPTTGGRAFINVFALNSAVESSLNYAKISYYTPKIFGVQLAASFTPSEGKDVVPFLSNGPQVPDRQKSIWEAAATYSTDVGPVSLSFSGGWSVGHNDNKTLGHAGLTDWAFGTEADYAINDDWKLAFGGAWREANSYAFDLNNASIPAKPKARISAARSRMGRGSSAVRSVTEQLMAISACRRSVCAAIRRRLVTCSIPTCSSISAGSTCITTATSVRSTTARRAST